MKWNCYLKQLSLYIKEWLFSMEAVYYLNLIKVISNAYVAFLNHSRYV